MTHYSQSQAATGARRFAGLVFSLAAAVLAATPARAQTAAAPAPDPADRSVVWNFDQVTEQATLLNAPMVERMLSHGYPQRLFDSGITGSATLEVIVGARGNVERVRVVDASRREFALVARDLARALRFKPAKVQDVPVRSRFTVPVDFVLREG